MNRHHRFFLITFLCSLYWIHWTLNFVYIFLETNASSWTYLNFDNKSLFFFVSANPNFLFWTIADHFYYQLLTQLYYSHLKSYALIEFFSQYSHVSYLLLDTQNYPFLIHTEHTTYLKQMFPFLIIDIQKNGLSFWILPMYMIWLLNPSLTSWIKDESKGINFG